MRFTNVEKWRSCNQQAGAGWDWTVGRTVLLEI